MQKRTYGKHLFYLASWLCLFSCGRKAVQPDRPNGYCRQRSGEVKIIFQSNWLPDEYKTGTTHGVWNDYDTHIPLIFMGWKIPEGQSNKEVYMTDIAPTLSALLHIQMPSGCIGKPIGALTDKIKW